MVPLSPVLIQKIALGVTLAVALGLFSVISLVFSYHWKKFGIPTPLFAKMNRLYFILSGSLAVLAVILFITLITTF